jgi:hypothetical protein
LNINTLAISYASKYPKTGLILFKILAFEREKLQLGLTAGWCSRHPSATLLQPFCNPFCNPYFSEYTIIIEKVAEKLKKNKVL